MSVEARCSFDCYQARGDLLYVCFRAAGEPPPIRGTGSASRTELLADAGQALTQSGRQVRDTCLQSA